MTTEALVPGSFPSLLIRKDALVPMGAFAEAQAEFLHPDPEAVAQLQRMLQEQRVGVVAHFYMDPELQGTLRACDWPPVVVADSLAMADAGVQMAEAGVERIVVLGVDFMSENVRAVLDAAGHEQVAVYRVRSGSIGCSLAEAAEAKAYGAYLAKARRTPRSLHVIYINTSLEVKARSHHLVPTLACTSSNVVYSVLQAFAQIPGLHLWFGPDTYMGKNLSELWRGLAEQGDKAIKAVHPAHDRRSVSELAKRFHYFEQGVCLVHHLFGQDVVDTVEKEYGDALISAHLEVPGEMFSLAHRAQQNDRGVVGSTSDILAFIDRKVGQFAQDGELVRFVLGTEAGMLTAIFRKVQQALKNRDSDLGVEIIFPVASDAITPSSDAQLGMVPGVSGGEGCSTAGGCATCPYMKLNSLDALVDLLSKLGERGAGDCSAFWPHQYVGKIGGRIIADLGSEPILHMRAMKKSRKLPSALVDDVLNRCGDA